VTVIEVNGRSFDEHGLSARAEARKRAGLHDPRVLELLGGEIVGELEEHAFSMIRVVYDLHWTLEDIGCHLEPPADLSTPQDPGKKSRLGSFLRRAQTRFIRAVNEGYVQQQEKFNTCFTRGTGLSYELLSLDSPNDFIMGGGEMRDITLSQRPCWDEETVDAVSAQGTGGAIVMGIPGVPLLEELRDRERLLLAVETGDGAAAEAQARFLPAFYHPRPLEFLRLFVPREAGLLIVSFPEGLEGREVCDLMSWAGQNLRDDGVVLSALNRGVPAGLSPDSGLVRFWPHRFLAEAMRGAGMRVSDWRAGERLFLKGENKS
jgi:hypothetical protein